MTLEERATLIADTGHRLTPGSIKWRKLRDNALQQLREVADEAMIAAALAEREVMR